MTIGRITSASPARSLKIVGIVAATLLLCPGSVFAQEELFELGNQRYQEEAYEEAIRNYTAVLDAGFESAELYYNLANAHFKAGALGPAILNWERSLRLAPGDPDVIENLRLARTLTVDDIEPLPRFWGISALTWWSELLSIHTLRTVVAICWLGFAGLGIGWILSRDPSRRTQVGAAALGVGLLLVVMGSTLVGREFGAFQSETAIILAPEVPVRSAPAEDDDLVLFEIHEGTRVRIDRDSDRWIEVVLDDGKVGWIERSAAESI